MATVCVPWLAHSRCNSAAGGDGGLVDYYRRIRGEHPDWDDYRRAMEQQRRVLVRVSIDTVGPTRAARLS
jgi:hypothetical protein